MSPAPSGSLPVLTSEDAVAYVPARGCWGREGPGAGRLSSGLARGWGELGASVLSCLPALLEGGVIWVSPTPAPAPGF